MARPKFRLLARVAGALVLLLALTSASARAATFVVNSTADTGAPGTLRWAINQANAAGAGTHTVTFALPPSSTIALASPLPPLNNASATILINGSAAAGLIVSGASPNQIFTVQSGPVSILNLSIAGTGNLTKTGASTLILSGTNTYSGGTTVSAGVLQGNTASLQGNIVDDANVTFNQTAAGTYAGDASGTGSLTKTGAGTLTLSGTNTYSGGTTVSAGVLQGNTTSLQGNIANNANVTFNQSTTGTHSGNVSGTGSLTKTGTGTVILSGTNTYTGGTTVSAGVLQGDTNSLQRNITNNANVTFDQTTAGTYAGNMSGTGSLTKTGSGTVILSGSNTYSGGTTVSAGVLQGNTTSLRGNIANDANVTFNQTAAGTYAGNMSGAGSFTKTGAGTLTLSGTSTYSGGTTVSAGVLRGNTTNLQGNITNDANVTFNQTAAGTYAGNMSGAGNLTKTGGGMLTLSGPNTYTGGTTVSSGILQGDTTSLQGNIVDNANVTFNQAAAGTYAGNISGTGSLAKTNAGTLTLSGTNTYTGGTIVSAGVLQGDTNSLQRNITNNANVTFDQSANGFYAGNMSGTGSLTKTGSGTVILSGSNTYSGGTTVSGGVLQGNTTSLRGNITNDANVTFDQTANGTYAGNMSGTGSLTKIGAGMLTLSGTSTYNGGTTVSAGVLRGNTANLQGNITNDANVTFNQTTTGTYAGNMSGAGSLVKTGSGTLTLSGANTYTGGTLVSSGVLQGDTTSLQGNIVDNARLTFNQSFDGTYAGNISGNGRLIKTGTGTVTLSGTNTYTNTTSIDQGRLDVNGSITSNTTVTAGGTLGGTGTITGNVTNQGTVAAGNSIGTLSVNGNFTQAAAGSMQVEINDGGSTPGVNNDLVDVSGTATLNGGMLTVSAAPGTYIAGTQFTFLEANSVVGTFDGISANLPSAFQMAVLGYTSNSAYFTLISDYASAAQTPNQIAVADYLDTISGNPNADLQIVLAGLNTLNAQQARAAFDQMSGVLYGTLGQVGLQDTTLIVAQLSERIRSGTFSGDGAGPTLITAGPVTRAPVTLASYSVSPRQPPIIVFVDNQPANAWTGWTFGYGLGGSAKGDGNATGLGYAMGGTMLGIERWLSDGERLGFFGGYQATNLNTMGPNQSGSIQGGQFGGYNHHDDGFNYYTLIGGLQFSGYNTQRFLQFDGIDRVANGDFSGWQSYLYLERGVKFQASRFVVQPYAALQYIYLRQNSFIETGADSLNLNVAGLDANSLRSLVGGRLQFDGLSRGDHRLLPEVRALWLHEFLATTSVVNSFFAPIGGGSFAVQGLNLGRDWALVGGGLRWESPIGCTLFGNYDAQVNSQQVFHVGSAGLEFDW
ncbi:MAG: autotransporter-associated beta strand repeat-containing protein [Pirellulales bacterium]